MAIYNMGVIHPMLAFVGVEFLPIFVFWPIILAPDMLESHSRTLKTRITTSFPKKLEPKIWLIGLGPSAR